MKLKFYKYQATGNDFILLNGFGIGVNLTDNEIRLLCDRHFGIGADGLIILRPDSQADFFMEFYNPDASIASFCGNGGRAIVKFAKDLGIIKDKTTFRALDGLHQAFITENQDVKLQMIDVSNIKDTKFGLYLNTGTHHVVRFVENLSEFDINLARKIRYAEEFEPEGTNVNFVHILDNQTIEVRTYEKGVEAETLSCGTGVVASALAANLKFALNSPIKVITKGGQLQVFFKQNEKGFEKVFLQGPVKQVFWGEIEL